MLQTIFRRTSPHEARRNTGQVAFNESLGFIDEPDAAWSLRKAVHKKQMQFEVANHDARAGTGGSVWWQWHYEPSFHCDFAERLGNMGEGGKWVCNPSSLQRRKSSGEPCLVYSVGSNGQFDFEQSVLDNISPTCEVHVFDPGPTDKKPPAFVKHVPKPRNVIYHRLALGVDGERVQGALAKPLSEIVMELGHAGRTIDIFKIDCEGCEWTTYRDWLKADVDIRQILVELHWRNAGETNNQRAASAHQFYGALFREGYVTFSKEPNTLGKHGGNCVEYSFLKLAPAFSRM